MRTNAHTSYSIIAKGRFLLREKKFKNMKTFSSNSYNLKLKRLYVAKLKQRKNNTHLNFA